MRWAVLAVVALTVACSVDRDLTAQRFDCEQGGACDGADSGVVDGGGRDGGGRDGGARDAGTPACLPGWGLAEACGGTLDGTWTLTDVCGGGWFESELQNTCPGALVQRADIVGTGRLTFDSTAMTYTASQALDVDADFTLPRFCRPSSCAESGGVLQLVLSGSVDCQESGTGGCDCTYDGPLAFTQDGEYVLDGERFVLDPDTTSELAFPYCVDGARLTYAQYGTTFIARR